jgi:glycosyltransferase involved in cell wall biosynthesis
MKILLVSEDIPARQLGGLGKHVVRLGNALLDRGHSVTLMGRADVDYGECADEVGFNGPFIGGFDWRRVGWKERSLGVFLPFKRPHIARRIARAIVARAGDFDVVHYHGHYPLVGRYVPASVNFVQTRHDQGSECLIHLRFRNGQICRETDPRACAACASIHPNVLQREISAVAVRQYRRLVAEAFSRHPTIFVSEFLRQRFVQIVPGVKPHSHIVIHNFIDQRSLPANSEAVGGAAQGKRIIVVGRIDEAKGVGAFLDVLSRRSPQHLDVEIVGDGPLRKSLEDSFSSASVRFLGWCPPATTVERIASADAMVVPSVWEEPCGTTILEGLALSKPVLALAQGGTPELKRYERWDGQLALFDSMEDLVDSLATNISHLAEPTREFEADVASVLPRLMAAYGARGRSTS